MTLLISCINDDFIIMTSDSALTTYISGDSGERIDYDTTTKAFAFEGIGCVTTWGEMTYNRIGKYYYDQKISRDNCSINDLANLTSHYLTDVYDPRNGDLEDVGYHVGGFDQEGMPRFFHIFWGVDRPKRHEEEKPDYKFHDHSKWDFVYNGRNDIAHAAVMNLLEETTNAEDIRKHISTSAGAASFCDYIARFAAGLTPEVGPPFYTYVISPDNSVRLFPNESLKPFNFENVLRPKLESRPIVLFADDYHSVSYPFSLPTGVILPELVLKFYYDEGDNLGITSNYQLTCSKCGRNYYADGTELVILGTLHFCPTCRSEQSPR